MTKHYDDLRWADDGGHVYEPIDDEAAASLSAEGSPLTGAQELVVDSQLPGMAIDSWEGEGGAVYN